VRAAAWSGRSRLRRGNWPAAFVDACRWEAALSARSVSARQHTYASRQRPVGYVFRPGKSVFRVSRAALRFPHARGGTGRSPTPAILSSLAFSPGPSVSLFFFPFKQRASPNATFQCVHPALSLCAGRARSPAQRIDAPQSNPPFQLPARQISFFFFWRSNVGDAGIPTFGTF